MRGKEKEIKKNGSTLLEHMRAGSEPVCTIERKRLAER